jgi:uncharacterized protein YigE (DUF2233 family)
VIGRLAVIAFIAILAGASIAAWMSFKEPDFPMVSNLPENCRDLEFEGVGHIVCEIDTRRYDVSLHLRDPDAKPYGSLEALARDVPFAFAMNAGMYHEDMSPVGLHVEDGVERAPLNFADGEGNFFMKPNGVFYVDREGRVGVMESGAYAAARPDVRVATQSGPMLVIDGEVHPRFEQNGASRYIRNGVGVCADGLVVFAISRSEVSLGSFARLFRDGLACPNALFFDGAISALHDGTRYVIGGEYPAGPMMAVRER